MSCYTCYEEGLTNLHTYNVSETTLTSAVADFEELIAWLIKHSGHTILTKEDKPEEVPRRYRR